MKAILLAASLFVSFTSCKKGENGSVTNEPQSGYLKGTVTDTKGNPMEGVTVLADNTLFYNSFKAGVSDARGVYKIALVNGTYYAYADFEKEYNGRTYKVKLHPDNNKPFSQEGAIVNFQWKLTGEIPDANNLRYGGTVMVDAEPGSTIYDSENIQFTLKPQGALIDGSSGSDIVMKPGQPRSNEYGKLVDIPIGRYKLTAVYNNKALQLRNGNSGASFTSEIIIDFEPSTLYGDNMAFVDYRE